MSHFYYLHFQTDKSLLELTQLCSQNDLFEYKPELGVFEGKNIIAEEKLEMSIEVEKLDSYINNFYKKSFNIRILFKIPIDINNEDIDDFNSLLVSFKTVSILFNMLKVDAIMFWEDERMILEKNLDRIKLDSKYEAFAAIFRNDGHLTTLEDLSAL